MNANRDTARKLAELSIQARMQRAQVQTELTDFRGQHNTAASVGMTVLETANSLGLNDPKMLMTVAKTVVLPVALTLGRFFIKRASPKRAIATMALLAGAAGIAKGIQYDNQRRAVKQPIPPTPAAEDK